MLSKLDEIHRDLSVTTPDWLHPLLVILGISACLLTCFLAAQLVTSGFNSELLTVTLLSFSVSIDLMNSVYCRQYPVLLAIWLRPKL